MRVIIYTGKGGVGKTSVAAATAMRSAKMGYRTLIMSTDAAHSLSDSLEVQLSGEIQSIRDNLDAIEVDILYEMEHRWQEIESYLSDFLESQGFEGVTAKELAVLPGFELLSALFYIWEIYNEGTYDVVIVDTAPTAETLRLLSFPDVSEWYMDKLYKMIKNMIRIARMTVGKVMSAPLPSNAFLKDMDMIRDRIVVIKEVLLNPEITSVRFVVNPERMVINETKRAYTYMCLYDMTVEALVINRLIPETVGQYNKEKMEEQSNYMKIIHEAFDPLTILSAYQMNTELVGQDKLDQLADMIFEDSDPTQIYSTEKPMEIYSEGGEDVLAVKLPFSEKAEVELYKASDDVLIIQVGHYKRSVTLPYALMKSNKMRAEFKNGRLLVRFWQGGDDGR